MKNDWYVKENGGKGNLVGVASKSSSWFIAEEILPEHAPLIAAAPTMVAALESSLEMMKTLQEKHLFHCAAVTRALLQNRIDEATAAIANAKGQGGE